MKRLFSIRGAAVIGLVLLLVFLVRPGAESLRGRVAQSMTQALGRNVEIDSVHLRFLPRLGFDLGNVVIHDDPAFGTEPLLRAPDVTAWLSMGALLQGRIAIASLTLSSASLNLTRNPQGKCNLEDLIERTSRTSLAPTGSERKGGQWSFPYIEAAHARINFKSGMEKTHFAFADSEFSLWQDSEDTWGARLKATPIRTDANLTDTGVIKAEGLWRRAARLHEIPLQFSFEWKQAQVGQLSTLVYGEDKGWRGNLALSGAVIGQPEHLRLTLDGSVQGVRRQDVVGGGELRLSAHCRAEYSSATRSLTGLDCVSPSGSGVLEVKGSAMPGSSVSSPLSTYDLWLIADKVPAQALLNTVLHAEPNFPGDLTADGELSATLQIRKHPEQPLFLEGHGSGEQLLLSSETAGSVVFGTVPFVLVSGSSKSASQTASGRIGAPGRRAKDRVPAVDDLNEKARVEIGPVSLALGKTPPLQTRATLSMAGYEASIRGDAGVKRLLQLARLLGIPAPMVAADGNASVDLAISGTWNGERPIVVGQAQLRSVRAEVRGVNAPVEIAAADLSIGRDQVKVQNLLSSMGNVNWRGSLQIPRPCRAPSACPVEFALRTAELDAAELNRLLNPAMAQKAWYSFLLSSGQQPFLLQARASGKLAIETLKLGTASCSHFAADLRLNAGELKLSNARCDVLGGYATGEWTADFADEPPKYRGSGTLAGISLADTADLMHDAWIDGTGAADYRVTAAGSKLEDLLASADLNANFTVAHAIFSHVVLPSAPGPLRAEDFSGSLRLQEGKFSFLDAKLKSAGGVYKVSGTASLNGALTLKIAGETLPGYNITGTLLKTRVTTIPVAQAALKP